MITYNQILLLLKNAPKGAPIEHLFAARIIPHLPKCKQRAIATVQCAMLDPDYKCLCDLYQKDYGFDLHHKMKSIVAEIYKRA